ncbi:MAG: DUF6602 domain-containing protein [Virgibacillus proomii]
MNEKVIAKLAENYCNLERTLIEELNIDERSDISSAEEIWQPVFKRIVPTKYNVEKKVYIIDSHKEVSQKVNLAIYDEQYTPYIFNYGTIKYIPIEAVAGVVLCENENIPDENKVDKIKKKRENWLVTIQELKTEMNAYVRIQSGILDTNVDVLYQAFKNDIKNNPKPKKQCQTSTRPITILCTNVKDQYKESNFDMVLSVQNNRLIKIIPEEMASLDDWYCDLNHFRLDRYKNAKKLGCLADFNHSNDCKENEKTKRTLDGLNVKKDAEQNVLLSLMFQFNQLLMIINNPMFFPHQSYVKAFNGGDDN